MKSVRIKYPHCFIEKLTHNFIILFKKSIIAGLCYTEVLLFHTGLCLSVPVPLCTRPVVSQSHWLAQTLKLGVKHKGLTLFYIYQPQTAPSTTCTLHHPPPSPSTHHHPCPPITHHHHPTTHYSPPHHPPITHHHPPPTHPSPIITTHPSPTTTTHHHSPITCYPPPTHHHHSSITYHHHPPITHPSPTTTHNPPITTTHHHHHPPITITHLSPTTTTHPSPTCPAPCLDHGGGPAWRAGPPGVVSLFPRARQHQSWSPVARRCAAPAPADPAWIPAAHSATPVHMATTAPQQ